jgi:hypothetical protein
METAELENRFVPDRNGAKARRLAATSWSGKLHEY